MEPGIEYKEVLATLNPMDISFIKSLLDANNIEYLIEGENFLQVRPLVSPAIIKVNKIKFEEAKDLLKDFKSGGFGSFVE